MTDILNFKNKNILITGGSRGIGKACAIRFAEQGANVAITYNRQKEEAKKTIEQLGTSAKHRHYKMNIAEAGSIVTTFDQVTEDFSKIDILVNNAGIFHSNTINDSFDDWQRTWNETINTNLTGVAHLCYLSAQSMMKNGGGSIINISSRGAFRGEPQHLAYGASKAGLNSLSQSLAVALAPHKIRVVALAPGFVDTDMAAEYLQGEKGEAVKQQSPLKRVATAEEVAKAVVMLAAEGLDFMTGGIVDFNGASYLRS